MDHKNFECHPALVGVEIAKVHILLILIGGRISLIYIASARNYQPQERCEEGQRKPRHL